MPALLLLVGGWAVEEVDEDACEGVVVLGHEVGELGPADGEEVVVLGAAIDEEGFGGFAQAVQQPLLRHVIRGEVHNPGLAEERGHGVDGNGLPCAWWADEEDEEVGMQQQVPELGPDPALGGCAHGVDGGPELEDPGGREVLGVGQIVPDDAATGRWGL